MDSSLATLIKNQVTDILSKDFNADVDFIVEHPSKTDHGDYATNVAMVLANSLGGENPFGLAQKIKGFLEKAKTLDGTVEKIEAVKPGFINFYLREEYLLNQVSEISKKGSHYGTSNYYKNKTVLVEYTDPNPFKQFHLGHLMSNTIGESIARLLEFSGAKVLRLCYQGDVGMHVAKTIWGWQHEINNPNNTVEALASKPLKKRVQVLGQFYTLGAKKYEDDENIKAEINTVNKKIYEKTDPEINNLYETGKRWSLDYFETIYLRLGTKFDRYYFESKTGKIGLEIVKKGVQKNIFKKSDGAIVFPGSDHGLHDRVFINSLGLPTYEAKELGLAHLKDQDFEYDLSLIITGNEITEYFKVLTKALSIISPELAKKTVHIPHGMLRLVSGKMSSRTGDVITGESLIQEVSNKIQEKASKGNGKSVVTEIAIGTIKYSMLKQNIGKDIVFDPGKELSLEGNTGSYLQYAYVRANSLVNKTKLTRGGIGAVKSLKKLDEYDMSVIKHLYKFPETVDLAAKDLSPHYISEYLFKLAQLFNAFYNSKRIIGSNNERFLLSLVLATRQVLGNGMKILGVKTVDRM